MKVVFKKNIPGSLVISVGLHLVLLVMAGALYWQGVEKKVVNSMLVIDVMEVRSRRSLRPVPRSRYVALEPFLSIARMSRGMEGVAVVSPVFESSAVFGFHEEDVSVDSRISNLLSPVGFGAKVSGGALQAAPVAGLGIGGVGGGFGLDISPRGGCGSAAVGLLAGPPPGPVLDLDGLTLPDLALVKVGKHIIATRESDLVDIVFVIDGSGSMKNDVSAVREHLSAMTDLFDRAEIDFTIGVVAFRSGTGYGLLGLDFEVVPQMHSITRVEEVLSALKFRGDEKGLDALIRAADEVTFRRGAEVHFIFITDEYVSGTYSSMDVMMKMKNVKIKVDVIGRDEPFQKFIAKSTGGVWLPISSLLLR